MGVGYVSTNGLRKDFSEGIEGTAMVEMKGPWDRRMGWQWECRSYLASGARMVQRRRRKGVVCQIGTWSLERRNEEVVPGGTASGV